MAGDDLNVWYDPEGDYLEIVFDQKAGSFEETSSRERDAQARRRGQSPCHLNLQPVIVCAGPATLGVDLRHLRRLGRVQPRC